MKRPPDGYKSWENMIQRCTNAQHPSYKHYGGRGISVCDKWRKSFAAFIADMSTRPSRKHSIERNDNDGNYEPGNCRWATAAEQLRNCRDNRLITFEGVTLCVADWAKRVGMSQNALGGRLRNGWSVELALTTPIQQRGSWSAGDKHWLRQAPERAAAASREQTTGRFASRV